MTRARDVSNIDGLLTTKGDIYAATGAGVVVRQGVGSDGQVLTADSAEADGLKWATVSSGWTQLATGTLSGGTTTISSIPGSYRDLRLVITGESTAAGNGGWIQLNGLNTSIYSKSGTNGGSVSQTQAQPEAWDTVNISGRTSSNNQTTVWNFYNYTTGTRKIGQAIGNNAFDSTFFFGLSAQVNSAITSINITAAYTTWTSGTYTLFGAN